MGGLYAILALSATFFSSIFKGGFGSKTEVTKASLKFFAFVD